MDPRKQIEEAIAAGDDEALRAVLQEMQEKGMLSSYLKGLMLFGAVRDDVPQSVDIMPFIDPDQTISGGPLLANVAYHTGAMTGDLDAQRMAVFFLLMHGANHNVSFAPTEHMEGATALSVFNMMVTSQIGKPDVGFPLPALAESLVDAGLDIGPTDGEAPKLEQIVNALHPFNLLQTKYMPDAPEPENPDRLNELLDKTHPSHAEMDEIDALTADYLGDPLSFPSDSPPFDGRQLMNATEIIDLLVRAGASLTDRIERAPEHYSTHGLPLIEALGGYVMILDTALDDPQAFQEKLEQVMPGGWDKPEFDLSTDHLTAAREFYARLHERAKEIYLDAKQIDRGGELSIPI